MQCVPLNVSQLKRAQPRGRLPWRPIMFMGLQVCIRAFTVPRGVACVVLVGVACCDTMSTRLVRSVGNMSWVSCTPCTQMLSCLEAMHCVGVVHRDVKPSNFLVDVEELCVPHPPPLPVVPPLPYHPPTCAHPSPCVTPRANASKASLYVCDFGLARWFVQKDSQEHKPGAWKRFVCRPPWPMASAHPCLRTR